MIDFNAIKTSLQEWVVRSSGLSDDKIIFSQQTVPRPAKTYISMIISSMVNIGQSDARGYIDDNGDADFIGNREFTLSLQCHGDNSLNILSLVEDSFNDPTEIQTLHDAGIVFVDQLLFIDTTELLETTWEERAQFDMLLRTISISTHNVGIIENVNMNSTYKLGTWIPDSPFVFEGDIFGLGFSDDGFLNGGELSDDNTISSSNINVDTSV